MSEDCVFSYNEYENDTQSDAGSMRNSANDSGDTQTAPSLTIATSPYLGSVSPGFSSKSPRLASPCFPEGIYTGPTPAGPFVTAGVGTFKNVFRRDLQEDVPVLDQNDNPHTAPSHGSNPVARTGPLPLIVHSKLVPEHHSQGKTGLRTPQPLATRKSQLTAAPTGGSDSDTDNDASDNPHASENIGSPQFLGEDDYDDEEERRFVDEFGFVIDEEGKQRNEAYNNRTYGKHMVRQELKWAGMASNWERTNTKMHSKLKERCRKGIPGRLRGVAWQLLLGSQALMCSSENADTYVALLEKKLRNEEVDNFISRDLARTFPKHVLFQEEGGVGQTFLRHVLHAYAGCDPEVGYVQGMAFLVGALSTQMAEEQSFWSLHEMMHNDRYKMRELFKPGFPMLQQFFYQLKRLISRFLPKLGRKFDELQIEPSFYASQWFLTLFVYHFPFRALLRVWDVFFSEGWKIIFRVAIALLMWEEKRLLKLEFEDLLPALKSMQDGKDAQELLSRAHRVKFKTAQLNRYGDEYWESIGGTL